MTLEELKEKRIKLAKMRSLLFHHELKSRRIKKIKSKEYHRRLQHSIRKKARRYSTLTSDEAQKKLQEEMEFNRIKERMTQKHSTMNRFARRVMRRGWAVADEQTKEALEEQLRQNQELKQKINSPVSSDLEDESADDSKTKTVLSRILNQEIDEDSVPKTGLLRLPFMQKAMQKQQEDNNTQVQKILQTLDPEEDPKSSPVINPRRSFTGSSKDPKLRPQQDTVFEVLCFLCLSRTGPVLRRLIPKTVPVFPAPFQTGLLFSNQGQFLNRISTLKILSKKSKTLLSQNLKIQLISHKLS